MNPLRWRTLFIAGLAIWAAYLVAPSVYYFTSPKEIRNSEEELRKRIPNWLPQNHVRLGLDLQGGVQLVLGVNTDDAVDNKLSRIGTEATRWSDDGNGYIKTAYVTKGTQALRVELEENVDIGDFKAEFKKEFYGLVQTSRSGRVLKLQYNEEQIKRIKSSAIEQAERVIRNRVDKWGVAEPIINRRSDNAVLVQLPGFKDPGKAKDLLGRTAQLKFKIVDDDFTGFDELAKNLPEGVTATSSEGGSVSLVSQDRKLLLKITKGKVPEGRELYFQREELAAGKTRFTTYVCNASTEITGEDVLDAFITQNTQSLDRRPEVALKFTGPGGKRFADVTGDNIKKRMAIILDEIVESAPVIQTKITGGSARITLGSGRGYNQIVEEANELSLILKSGALPATITVMEERQVGASLGPELADQGVKGAMMGLCLVVVFMIIYYRRPGLIACTALTLNALLLLALMAGFGFALTLPGIAGFILTLGMAVDANVLINERIRQELREGKNAKKGVENGFKRVFWTIIDANVTTLIAALVLLETNSSGPIRGFAITLMLGLMVSVFTSLYCSRFFFEFVLSRCDSDAKVRAWLGGDAALKKRDWGVNFLKYGKIAAVTSILIAVIVIGTAGVRGINWGVDFAGGTEMLVGFDNEVEAGELKKTASTAGIKTLTLQEIGTGKTQYLLRFDKEKGDEKVEQTIASGAAEAARINNLQKAIKRDYGTKGAKILQTDFVGPQIGKELRNQGVISVIYAIIGVLLYIGLRFDMRFGPGAVVKMVQDVFVILGFYVFFWRSFDLTTVAAFLTVVGYSVNDTIVIYDRIRENLTLHAKRTMEQNINNSLNETLTRTINTSVTTIIALSGILIFGSGQIWNFAIAMTIGVVAATLSSQFLASSFVLWLETWKNNRTRKKIGKPAKAR